MDLSKLLVATSVERTKTGLDPVLVLTDGTERIVLRTTGDPAFLSRGIDRLITGATDLAEQLLTRQRASELEP